MYAVFQSKTLPSKEGTVDGLILPQTFIAEQKLQTSINNSRSYLLAHLFFFLMGSTSIFDPDQYVCVHFGCI